MTRLVHRHTRRVVRCLVAAAMASACSLAGAEITVRDDAGQSHRYAASPRRIVSLLPSLTETVCALGACARLVGVDRYSNWPASVAGLPQLGGLDDAQIEAIVALRPDAVLAATSARVTQRLEALGVSVVVLEPKTHADVRRSLQVVAALLGTPDAGDRVWAAIEADLRTAAARVPADVRGRTVYFEVGSEPYAAGASSFIGQTLARLGLVNIVPAALGPFPKLNPEFVVRARPDIVMASQRELQDMATRPGWQTIEGLAPGHRCAFTSARFDTLVRPGPRLGEAALVLAGCLADLERRP